MPRIRPRAIAAWQRYARGGGGGIPYARAARLWHGACVNARPCRGQVGPPLPGGRASASRGHPLPPRCYYSRASPAPAVISRQPCGPRRTREGALGCQHQRGDADASAACLPRRRPRREAVPECRVGKRGDNVPTLRLGPVAGATFTMSDSEGEREAERKKSPKRKKSDDEASEEEDGEKDKRRERRKAERRRRDDSDSDSSGERRKARRRRKRRERERERDNDDSDGGRRRHRGRRRSRSRSPDERRSDRDRRRRSRSRSPEERRSDRRRRSRSGSSEPEKERFPT